LFVLGGNGSFKSRRFGLLSLEFILPFFRGFEDFSNDALLNPFLGLDFSLLALLGIKVKIKIFNKVLPLIDVVFVLVVLWHLSVSIQHEQQPKHKDANILLWQFGVNWLNFDSDQRNFVEALTDLGPDGVLVDLLFKGEDIAFYLFVFY
jgi:hypothetical protein